MGEMAMTSPSNTTTSQAETCPICSSAAINETIDELDYVCEQCGFVITPDQESVSLDWEITEGEFREPQKDWMAECPVRNGTEQQLAEAFESIEDFTERFKLPDKVRKETVEVYCNAFRRGITDGRKTTCFVAACLHVASRQASYPIPINRLSELSVIESDKLHRSHVALYDELEIGPHTPKPSDYLDFLHAEVGFSSSARNQIEQTLEDIEGNQTLVGKNPAGIAAAATYLCHDDYTQLQVAKAVGLSTETIRQRVIDLKEIC